MRNERDGGRKTGLRVVLDTNVYVAAFHFPEGMCAQLVEFAAEQHYELIISPVIIREFSGASRRDFLVNEEKHVRFLKFLGKIATIVVPRIIPDVIREDPSDNHILACALTGKTNLIVSQDLDLLRLKTYGATGIISPTDFLNTLEGYKKVA